MRFVENKHISHHAETLVSNVESAAVFPQLPSSLVADALTDVLFLVRQLEKNFDPVSAVSLA